jgi:hypothetical protein
MSVTDQSMSTQTRPATTPLGLPGNRNLTVEPATPLPPQTRVNWLFSGVLLGAASWMLVLGIVFAVLGNLIIAGALFCGIVLCCLAIWRAGRRLDTGRGPGRHRAEGSAVA